MADKLTDMIDQLVHEKTFNLEGVRAIEQLRTRAAAQETEIEALNARCASRDETIAKMRAEVTQANAQLQRMGEREAAVAVREAKTRDLEMSEARATAGHQAFRDAFTLVFRNPVMKEQAYGNRSQVVNNPGGYQQNVSVPESQTIERTTE